jgi:hypothetical protein
VATLRTTLPPSMDQDRARGERCRRLRAVLGGGHMRYFLPASVPIRIYTAARVSTSLAGAERDTATLVQYTSYRSGMHAPNRRYSSLIRAGARARRRFPAPPLLRRLRPTAIFRRNPAGHPRRRRPPAVPVAVAFQQLLFRIKTTDDKSS